MVKLGKLVLYLTASPVPCPVCGGALALKTQTVPKEEGATDSVTEERVVQCRTFECRFTVPFTLCLGCQHVPSLMNAFICGGSQCKNAPISERVYCWECAQQCQGDGTQCLGSECHKCIKRLGKDKKILGCEHCSLPCDACGVWLFSQDRDACRKCRTNLCKPCAENPGCKCDKSKKRRKKKEEESDFEEDDEGEDDDEPELSDME